MMLTVWVLSVSLLLTSSVMVMALRRAEALEEEGRKAHAKCIALVSHYVGNQFAASVLEEAANRFETPEGKRKLHSLVETDWKPDGPSMPALWMRREANRIRNGEEV